ncbi:hypothetical protein A6A25_20630 [Saccharothrix sp. CB00851]|nr:hypothetical protein A6A25_20630 [Saccharothrix sp. CB00851]
MDGLGRREGPLTEYEAAAQSYQDMYGWQVGVYGSGVWLVTGRQVEALDMPEGIGARLLDRIDAPVFESPHDDAVRWVVLVKPHDASPIGTRSRHPDIDHVRSGRAVDLPPSRFGRHLVRWIVEPDLLTLPDFDAVLRALPDK